MKFVDVILPLGLDDLYTYSVPQQMEALVVPYVRVQVPLGASRTYVALVIRVHENKPENITVKDILQVVDARAVLLDSQYSLWKWIAAYYMAPVGDVYRAALPTGMKTIGSYRPRTETCIALSPEYRTEQGLHAAIDSLHRAPNQQKAFCAYLELSGWDEAFENDNENENKNVNGSLPTGEVGDFNGSRVCASGGRDSITREALMNHCHASSSTITALCSRGLLYTYENEVGRLNTTGDAHPENIKQLNEYQQLAYEQIYEQWNNHSVCLLHGVTSSGKTEIYIRLIQDAIDKGGQVLYLLPEIALTVQITQRLQRVFGSRIGIYHSKYSDAERVEIWQKQLSSQPYDIILGARSAVFLPMQRLSLVIVDEEHETSFKQQDPAPRYNGRSVAIVLAGIYGAKTLLGTATPSMETYYNAQQSKYGYVRLSHRYKELQLPDIKVVDVKDLRRRKIMRGLLSPDLTVAISNALKRGEQVIIFQNRRGFSPMIECHQCGWVPKCPNCDVSLTYHKNMNHLSCHYCGYVYRMPTECPDCHNPELKDRGYGTEKIEDILQDEFPEARISRMDLDTTRTRNAYERIISDFSQHKTDILIGTQMVTKGLDFDNVSVVGIISADTMLNQPDFRAWEHSFIMMTQVAGRAGRKGTTGTVILQTLSPQLPVIGQIVRNDHESFYRDLLIERGDFHYPPFTRLIYIYLKHRDENIVNSAGVELASRLRATTSPFTLIHHHQTTHHPPPTTQYGTILGPDKPAVARIKTLFIRKIMVKVNTTAPVMAARNYIRTTVAAMLQDARYKSLQVFFDVDPE